MNESLLISFTEQLSHDLELAEVPLLDANRAVTFSLGNALFVSIKTMDPGFYFFSSLGTCPDKSCEEFFALLMHANLFGRGTGGGVIGLSENGKNVTFTKKCPFQMNYAEFKLSIEDFVNYVDLWQKKISDQLKG